MTRDSRPIRVVIVDDEPVARSTLRGLLAEDDEVEIVAECANGREAVEVAQREKPDLMFLDVEMPELDGLGVLERLPERDRPAVVFTTAFDRYALKAFEEQAVDYLLKPFDDERFLRALERAKERVRQDALLRMGQRMADLVASIHADARAEEEADEVFPDRISVHKEGGVELVDVDELVWVQAADQYVRLHTGHGEHLMRRSMGELEKLLDPSRFYRVHRSAIIALDRVAKLETRSGGTGRILLKDGTWVPVSRSRISAVRRRLG